MPRRSSPPPQTLLVLHFDAAKLRSDGLHLGDFARVSAAMSVLALNSEVVVEDITTRAELLEKFAMLAEQKQKFDVIVAVGHSNKEGIRIASDCFATWEAFAEYIAPFAPRRLALIACKAGRWPAGEILFEKLRKLRRVYACPSNASKTFGKLVLLLVPYLVAERRPKDDLVFIAQAASIALSGCQLREWRRTSDEGNPDSVWFDLAADVFAPLVQKVPRMLGKLVGQ